MHFNILFNTVTNKKEFILSILTLIMTIRKSCTLLNNLHVLYTYYAHFEIT